MYDYLNIAAAPIRAVLPALLRDKTTGRNIVWGTDSYAHLNEACVANAEITEDALLKLDAFELQPRVMKAREEQQSRTRGKGEVFTPSWICNLMNNACDEEWFGRKDVFNTTTGEHSWRSSDGQIEFEDAKGWKRYVDSTRLEITCGEAPFIVSRYDAATGEEIPIPQRIGMLDRKLRVVRENVQTSEEWFTWSRHAVESVYGYEFQGDNLLIARINVLMTWFEYSLAHLGEEPNQKELGRIVNVICWNFWQMDGLKGTVPFAEIEAGMQENTQINMFDFLPDPVTEPQKTMVSMPCRIYDWRKRAPLEYNDLKSTQG